MSQTNLKKKKIPGEPTTAAVLASVTYSVCKKSLDCVFFFFSYYYFRFVFPFQPFILLGDYFFLKNAVGTVYMPIFSPYIQIQNVFLKCLLLDLWCLLLSVYFTRFLVCRYKIFDSLFPVSHSLDFHVIIKKGEQNE